MKNSKAIGSPISQNGRNVNTFSERNFKGSPDIVNIPGHIFHPKFKTSKKSSP